MDYGERYDAKRAAGISEFRSDGSRTSRATDEHAGPAEEFAVLRLGQTPNREIYARKGDGGSDCVIAGLTVDVVHLGLHKDGTPRSPADRRCNLIINPHEPWRHCDIYVVVMGANPNFEFAGWYAHHDLVQQPTENFGYGDRYCVPVAGLRPIAELLDAVDHQETLNE